MNAKGIRINTLFSVVTGNKNSEIFVCKNSWKTGAMSRIRELINILSNGVDARAP